MTFLIFTSGNSPMTLPAILWIYFLHATEAGPTRICLLAHVWSLSRLPTPILSRSTRQTEQSLESQSFTDTHAGTSQCHQYGVGSVYLFNCRGNGGLAWVRRNAVTMVMGQLDGVCECSVVTRTPSLEYYLFQCIPSGFHVDHALKTARELYGMSLSGVGVLSTDKQ